MPARLREYWANLLRFGFHLLYNQLAWSYDAVSWLVSFGAWRDWQRAALPYILGPDVLEIAHGPGHMLLALQDAGYRVRGIDLSPQMLALSRRRLQKVGANVSLLRAAAQNLPLRSQLFDSVLVTFPSEFLLVPESLGAVHRVLKDDGRFIIVPAAQFTGHSLPERFVEWLYQVTGQRRLAQEVPAQEQTGSRRHSLRQLFHSAGFCLEIHSITLKQSQVTLLLAQKTSIPEQGK